MAIRTFGIALFFYVYRRAGGLKMNIVLTIKPTKHNIETLKKRGLYSDDSRYFFKMYEDLMNEKEYTHRMDGPSDQLIAQEFMEANLKF